MTTIITTIVSAYRKSLETGARRCDAANAAWSAVRATEGYRHLRAPSALEAVALNTGRRRSFRCPLGEVLAEADSDLYRLGMRYGQYCSDWPRTVRSYDAADAMRDRLLDTLDRLAGVSAAQAA